jgi:TolB-like protein/lipoprotein NlpI
MLTKKGQAKITDFGLAKLSWGIDLTKTSTIMGTVAYMSPEQAKGEEVDHRTDIWSLGAMLYEMISRERPFQKSQEQALIYAILNDKPTPLSLIRSDIPSHIEQVVEKALAKKASERYQNIQELIQDLNPTITFPKTEKSIVVLPFENLSPDPEQEYFCDGMTEEITSDLSTIHSLRVISRNSAMMLKGTRKSTKAIGKELDVEYVLEGSVRKAGNNLRITAQLIEAANDAHLWAKKYSGTLDDVFDIQEKVSRSIVDALKIKLTEKEDRQIANRPIEDVNAYECHLRAQYHLWLLTDEGLDKAQKFIDMGLEIIGRNEILFCDKGLWYIHYQDFVGGKDESLLNKAEECVKEIFLLNPDSAFGNFLNGQISRKRGNAQAAVREFKKAIQVYPENPDFLVWLNWVYGHSGQIDAAQPFINKLLEIDPFAPISHMIKGNIDFFNGEFKSAIKSIYKGLQFDIQNSFYRFWYAVALGCDQRNEESSLEFETIKKATPNTFWTHQLSDFFVNAIQGNKIEALQSIADETNDMFRKDEIYPIWMAECYAMIDEKEQAMNWLEHGIGWGFINYPFLNEYDPFLKNIRGEPQFKKLMERVKHEWENFEV